MKTRLKFCFGLLFLQCVYSLPTNGEIGEDLPLAETNLGKVRGTWDISRSGRKYAAFKGIPYAKPPIGKLRLQAPEPVGPWEGTLDAIDDSAICVQQDGLLSGQVKGTEDCLYLSVFTHNVSGKAPVIVHIHGGGFISGAGNIGKPNYLLDEDLVVVAINYRLGPLGFLTFETEELRGNQGLKDQVLALKWVKENIAAFGGDPDSVTIIGESAGGASVHLHTVSPMSKGLFHRAISESGTGYSPWAVGVPGTNRRILEKLLKLINCPTTPDEAIPCLISTDGAFLASKYFSHSGDLMEAFQTSVVSNGLVSQEPPGPDAFLPGSINDWTPNPVPLLIGTTSAEGVSFTLAYDGIFGLKNLTANFDTIAPILLLYQDSAPNPKEVTQEIRNYYSLDKDITIADWVNFSTIFTDDYFAIPIINGANLHTGEVYFYFFDYIQESDRQNKLIFGARHCIESKLIWGSSKIPEQDYELSKKFVKLVSSFAKNGTPLVDEVKDWKKWTSSDHTYMEVDRDGEFHLKKGLAEDRYNFWKNLDYRSNYNK